MPKGVMEKMRQKAMGFTAALVLVGFGAAACSLFHWQIVKGEEMRTAAMDQSLRSTSLPAMRGSIYDATGTKVLAQSASVWTVVLEPAFVAGDEDLRRRISAGLAPILGLDEQDLYETTGKKDSYYEVVKRKVEADTRDAINQFLLDNGISSGVRLVDDYKRYYPYGTVAANILGFTGQDGQGLEGLELYYDDQLSGTPGRMVSARNGWNLDMPFEKEQMIPAENGHDLVLTIDETVQSILKKYLAEGIEKYAVKNGAVAIVMDVKTGGILGLSTKPDYDPNDPFTVLDENLLLEVEALPQEEQAEAYSAALNRQWRNKAVVDTYYPGSVFKMCVGAMGLEEGLIEEASTWTCTGKVHFEGMEKPIQCWKHAGHGNTTFREGLCNSCNPWFMHIGDLLGAQTFAKYREAFGFTEKTGIDLPGESYSLYHSVENLGPVELACESFGQNFSITPVQMITASCAIANGGHLVRPHVVDRIVDTEGNIVRTADTSYRRQVISEETAATVADILRQNAEVGTANGGYVMGYRVCGKTGTSEKVDKHNQDPTKPMEYVVSYCGFAPAEDPQYALLVFFDEPDGEECGMTPGGNGMAGPIFSKIMEEILPYLGVDAQYTEQEYQQLDMVSPAVTGKTLEDAYAELEEMGLSYSVVGNNDSAAIVNEQIPESGANVPKGGKVVLYTDGYSEEGSLVEVPDFTGYDLANASYLASINGLQISVNGASAEGTTVSLQSITPGNRVKLGTVVTLTFVENVITDTPSVDLDE